jgi:hypothetical protein
MSRSAFQVGIRNARTGRAMAALRLLPTGASPHCFTCPARGVLFEEYQIMGNFASDQIGFEAAQPMTAAWEVRGSNLFHQGVGEEAQALGAKRPVPKQGRPLTGCSIIEAHRFVRPFLR